ncbi:undecaprenyldiphospho-muramoylpentapeptide beta-N-acetylglucosaminyltransferase [Pseudodesulfovibrio cashew]|uniref:UDP-N-acetylglucosamine--N-acetylmuramyl-(pentapeptide) pyrophosphoryl-undecaprenol N-acetylglucosamine transferase n=1 Tax=Pseudodesulfovibrio cashew TaxID=2678688 RepID=A0A6I6JR84_9BACT|nr:undecaprenyldiphospho-muramoylpentapeptide beta-N-acetylglucosaminyltransferase [Pseudodesulfovibrio cashew]QGY40114.1 undecaprenyldiphospho-muramoylpentapeptide beta-N-acetylglucosaminyltransferase [Pseudodesulfovibrio cashew]
MSLTRVILTTGGTGGHIFPALAVADELRRRNPGVCILFLGGSGPEGELARGRGIEFQELPAKGIMGRGLSGALSGLGWLCTGIPKALGAVRRFGPDAVVGFGGYAGFCPVLAAAMTGVPTAVHEQNSVPGVTNKVLGKVVRKVFLSFPDVMGVFPAGKTVLTGNPVRREIARVPALREGRTPAKRVLVLGGSQGARPVNEAIIAALPELMKAGVTLVHQAGKTDFQRVRASYETAKADPTQVHAFIEDMAAEYARADLIVCRAGATTVFEVAAAGVPAVFVPFPQATHDHQTMNAKAMADIGAALLLPQKGMDGTSLAGLVLELLGDDGRLANMAKAARGFARPEAAADIAKHMENLAA